MTSDQLCAEQIKNLLDKYKEPEKARRFLIDAGIIDEHGNLMPQYQPIKDVIELEGVTSQ
jgi:hypothetical protein